MSVTVGEALINATKWLSEAGIPNAEKDARLLLAHAMGCEASRLILMNEEEIHPDVFLKFDGFLASREKFQPVSQIIGGREFWGRWFKVTPDVLDPRPETETLIDIALNNGPSKRILDLGTGSGVLAITLAAEWPDAKAVAVDISSEAIDVAKLNATANSVGDRVEFGVSDWFDAVQGKFDLIVSNPPYIALSEMAELSEDVRNWEPFMALTPGGDGLDSYRTIAFHLDQFLDVDGLALFEIGYAQGEDVTKIFANAGYENVFVVQDMGGKDRIVMVKR